MQVRNLSIHFITGCSAEGHTGLFWRQVFVGSNPTAQTIEGAYEEGLIVKYETLKLTSSERVVEAIGLGHRCGHKGSVYRGFEPHLLDLDTR